MSVIEGLRTIWNSCLYHFSKIVETKNLFQSIQLLSRRDDSKVLFEGIYLQFTPDEIWGLYDQYLASAKNAAVTIRKVTFFVNITLHKNAVRVSSFCVVRLVDDS